MNLNCDLSLNSVFLDASFPIFKVPLGNISCGFSDFLQLFFKISGENGLMISGIKIWIIFPIVIFLFVFSTIKLHKKKRPTTIKGRKS